jgi:hypothetical protein
MRQFATIAAEADPPVALCRLLSFSPNLSIAAVVDLNMDHIGSTADRAVFDVFLADAGRHIERHDDLFTACIANIAGLILHAGNCQGPPDTDPHPGKIGSGKPTIVTPRELRISVYRENDTHCRQ